MIILISLVVFVGSFYLANLLYPQAEKQTLFWHKKKLDKLSPKLDQMFLDVPASRLILLDIAAPLVCGLLGFITTHKIWVAIGAAILGLAIPAFVIKQLEKRRRQKFAGQLVDTILILCSTLKVGMSLQQAFGVLVEEIAPPMAQEFSLVLRQMRMGYSLEDALGDLKKRMCIDELDMVVTSLLIARETGGDITEVLTKVANAIAERNKIIGKVKALTVQAKLQGAIMSIIPIAFVLFIYKADPHFFDVFLKDNFGKMFLVYAAISQVLGIYFILKLSKVDI